MMLTRTTPVLAALLIATIPLANAPRALAQLAPPPSEPPPGYAPPPPPPGYGSAPPNAPPPNAPPPPRARPGATEVRFEPEQPGLQLLSMSGGVPVERFHPYRRWWGWGGHYSYGWAPVYSPVCDEACATSFVPGPYRLALSKNGGPPVPAYTPAFIQGPSLIRGAYTDRSGLRAAGWVIGIAGVVGGIVMIAASARTEDVCDLDGFCERRETANGPLLVGGIGVLLASGITGGVLAAQRDEAHISIEPLHLASFGALRESLAALRAETHPEGAALALHF